MPNALEPCPGAPPTLVGRSAQLAIADAALAALLTGRGNVLTVVGGPGIGKTTLMQEVVERAQSLGVRVLRGTALSFERDLPFSVAIDAFGVWVGRTAAGAPGQLGRYRVHRVVAQHLQGLGAQRPVLIALDDLHWADEASCEFIAHLIRRWPTVPLLGMFAYRPSQVSSTLRSAIATAAKECRVTELQLAPLSARETDEVLQADLTAMTRRWLHRMSGGNPLYLRELWRAPCNGNAGVPARILDLVEDEVATLSPAARLLLKGAVVAGEPFDVGLAAAIAEISEADTPSVLDELEARGLVRRIDTVASRPVEMRHCAQLVFRCPIVGRAIYESIGEGWRRAAHRRAAEALAHRSATSATRAHHVERYAELGDTDAATVFANAGRESAARVPTAAAHWFAAALRTLPRDSEPEQRLSLLASLASSLGTSGQTERCRDVLDEALTMLHTGSSEVRARCVSAAARVHHVVGDRSDIRALIDAELRRGGDVGSKALLHTQITAELSMAGDWERMAALATKARRTAQQARNHPQLAAADALGAIAHTERGAGRRAVADLERAREIVDELVDGQVAPALEALLFVGQAEHVLAQHARAVGHLQRGLTIARATGQELFVVPLTVAAGFANASLGRLDVAVEAADVAVRASAGLGADRPRALALMLRCVAAAGCGEFATSIEAGYDAVKASQSAASPVIAAAANRCLGEALIESGAHLQGIARILDHCGGDELTGVAAHLRPHVCAVLSEAQLSLGRIDDAQRWVMDAERYARALALGSGRADAALARAALLIARRDAQAVTLALEAVSTYSTLGQVLDAARANMLAGHALALTADRDRALRRLQLAHAAFDAAGALRLRDRVARDLRALGRPTGRSRQRMRRGASAIESLSPREREIAELVTSGYSNREIAGELYVATKTIETHLSNIFGKLGVSSRAEVAARWAAQSPGS